LESVHRSGDGLIGPYGPPPPATAIQIVEAFDPVEIEYASIRRHAAVFDAPHRATLVFTGPDRLSFLNRMLTQELKGFEPFTARRAFTLNRKGRVDADLRLINLPDRLLVDVDAFAAERARTELDKYIITEEVAIADATAEWSVLSLHGPAAAALLARVSTPVAGAGGVGVGVGVGEIKAGEVSVVRIGGGEVVVDRWDWAGEIGLELRVPSVAAGAVYDAISTPWSSRPQPGAVAPSTDLARRIGWHALNIARIEAGTPMYMLDFGPDSLPHECGDEVLNDRVSFKKGCYLGQEIVARMQSLGHPKQKLVAIRMEADAAAGGANQEPQAVTGTPLVEADAPGAGVVGAVTSSCLSPMLSQAPIAIAMVKYTHSKPQQHLWAQLDGGRMKAAVQEGMRFLVSA
jgi:folate-binding protein YgfZ